MDVDNMKTVIDTAQQAVDVGNRAFDFTVTDAIPVALVRQGESLQPMERVLQIHDERAEAPRRRKGTATFAELASFIDHVNRFKDESSVIFADVTNCDLTAVLDYHLAGAKSSPRWGQHRSVYASKLSPQWELWTQHDGQKMVQDVFAQFIEDHMDDLRAPTGNGADKDLPMPSDVLTMARNLVVKTKGEFSRSFNPTTGESSLVNKYENETTSTKIPRAFLIGIPVFEAGALYAVEARLRLDMSSGRPLFSYSLYRADEIKRDAFGEVRQVAHERTGLPVLAGSPE